MAEVAPRTIAGPRANGSTPTHRDRRRIILRCLVLFLACLVVYELTSYGGIRSPDSEIVYRTAVSLANGDGFAISRDIEDWPGFGVARGLDGRLYSIFGPGQSIAEVPLVLLGQAIAETGYFDRVTVPVSHYVEDGLGDFATKSPPKNPAEHGKRWIVARLNVLVSALGVVVAFLIARRMAHRDVAGMVVALIFGFGTLAWPYSGTCFSEPLANLLVLLSFLALVSNDPRLGAREPDTRKPLMAGLCLGAATATHLTAVLFVPFAFAYAIHPYFGFRDRRRLLAPALAFLGGVGIFLALLGYYDLARFGNVFETGRTVDAASVDVFGYGRFTNPLLGLYGLLIGPHTGLVLFAPILVLTALGWSRFHRMHPFLAKTIAAAVVFRLLFIASRSDWHGGFSLGPRYMLMVVPFLCFPLVPLIADVLDEGGRRWGVFVASVWLLITQQIYFSLGEVFTYYYARKLEAKAQGIDIFAGERIYLEVLTTPLLRLHDGFLGAFRLRWISESVPSLLVVGCTLFAIAALLVYRFTPLNELEPQPDAEGDD